MNLFKKKNTEENSENNETKPFDKRSLVNGSYAMAVTAIVIAAVIIINFIVGAVPSKFTKFDISSQKLFTIGDTSKQLLDGLSQDVTINWLTETGKEDTTIEHLLDTYSGASSHVKINKVDTVANPTFASTYTQDTLSDNSLIVTCGEKSKAISYDKIYQYDSSSYYNYTATGFDGEGQITSAISYVTSDENGVIYYTTGHGEFDLSTDMTDSIEKANMTSKSLNLLSSDIPADCTCLIIFSPTTDFTTEEAAKVTAYLADGGHAFICSLTSKTDTPNFDSILSAYGVTRVAGFIIDPDSSHYTQAQYLLMPEASTSSTVTSGLSGLNLVYAYAQGITVAEGDDSTYTVTPLLTSSSSAYSKALDATSLDKADGDQAGPFDLAVQIEETLSNDSSGASDVSTDTSAADISGDTSGSTSSTDTTSQTQAKETKILYYTTPCAFSSDALSSLLQTSVSLPSGNSTLFANSMTYLTDKETTVSIAVKSLSTPKITVSESAASALGNLTMFALPAAVLAAGIIILVRRRAR